MSRRAWGPVIFGLVALGLSAFMANNFVVTSDVAQLLSTLEDKSEATLIRAVADSELSRTLIISLGAADSDQASRASEVFADLVSANPEVAWLQNAAPPGVEEAVYGLYFPRRFGFVSPRPETGIPSLTSGPALQAAAQRLREQLSLPTAPLIKRLAPADPLLLFMDVLSRFEAARPGELALHDGRFVTADGKFAIVFIGTHHGPLDADAQEPLLAAIDAAAVEVSRQLGAPIALEKSGIHPFGVDGRRSVERDVSRISTVSIVAITLLLIWALRSLRLILLAMLPIAFGLLAGLSAGLALFGEIHGLTLAFAATLIGVCIDYPIHLFTAHVLGPVGQTPQYSMAHSWSGIALGAATTALSFVTLAFSSLPGLEEVGVVCAIGIVAALLVTRFVLPPLMPDVAREHRSGDRLATRLECALVALASRRAALGVILTAAVIAIAATLPFTAWSNNLSALSARDPAILAEDTAVRQRISTVEPGRIVVALGASEEAALLVTEELVERLQSVVDSGGLGGFRSVNTWLWSTELQLRNRAEFAKADLGQRLPDAFAEAGFKETAFGPFVSALEDAFVPLTWSDLVGSPLESLSRPFRLELDSKRVEESSAQVQRVGFLVFLQGVHDGTALQAEVAKVDGAVYLDQQGFMNRAYSNYRDRTAVAVFIGMLVLFLTVGLRYRDRALVLIAAAPALLACGFTMSVLTWVGTELNLIHIVSMLLVTAIGFDYGIFLAEVRRKQVGAGMTMVAIVFAAVTTLLGFGLLGLSANPAMNAIGVTVTLGIATTLVLAPCIVLLLPAGPKDGPSVSDGVSHVE